MNSTKQKNQNESMLTRVMNTLSGTVKLWMITHILINTKYFTHKYNVKDVILFRGWLYTKALGHNRSNKRVRDMTIFQLIKVIFELSIVQTTNLHEVKTIKEVDLPEFSKKYRGRKNLLPKAQDSTQIFVSTDRDNVVLERVSKEIVPSFDRYYGTV